MTRIYYEDDADMGVLEAKTIAIIGYGNQGSAQAQNMRDSGLKVIIGSIPDALAEQAKKDKTWPYTALMARHLCRKQVASATES